MKKKQNKSFLKKIILWSLAIFFGSTFFFVLLYKFVNPPLTPLMVMRVVEQITHGEEVKLYKDWESIDNISPYLYNALIASEDNLFMAHRGFDTKAIKKAMDYNKKKKGKKIRGASTISQQVAKNVFLWPGRSYIRKGFEVYFTFMIETFWNKKRIMEVYLNVIEFGDGIYGAEAAAQTYFHKSAKKLSRSEAILMAVCVPSPIKWNPNKPSPYIYNRQSFISNLMPKLKQEKF